MDSELISVIVAVYNSEKFLCRCVDSIINNSYSNLEVILVDDGSTDKSGEICDKYVEKDRRVKVIHKKNGGTAAARNSALEIAKGNYIAFADNDDFIHPDYYKTLYNAIKETQSDIAICELTRDMEESEFFEKNYDSVVPEIVDKHDFILGTYADNWTRNTTPWNKLYNRKLFDDIRFPDGKGYEDAYTTYKLIYKAEKIALINATLYFGYPNLESYSSKPNNPKKLMFREEAIRLQSEYYRDKSYKEVGKAAKRFYLKQLFFMYCQLRNDYEKNKDLPICIKYFKGRLYRYYHTHFYLLNKEESFTIFEYLHHLLGGVINKFKSNH